MKKYSELTNQRTTLADKIPMDSPFGLYIDPTNFCNFQCTFCPRNLPVFQHYAGDYCHMTLDLFQKILNGKDGVLSFRNRLKVIRLYFLGEPLCNPQFIDMLKLVFETHASERIEITTNASLLNEKNAMQILLTAKQYPEIPLYMRYSIESVDQERFESLTKRHLSIDSIRQNVAGFQSLRDQMQVKNVLTYAKMLESLNPEENKRFLEEYTGITDDIALEKLMNWSGAEKTDLITDTFGENDAQTVYDSIAHKVPLVCEYPFTTLAINADGTVVCCCVDWSRSTQVGDLKTQSLQEIWNGEQLRRIRYLHLTGNRRQIEACKQCKQLPCHDANGIGALDHVSEETISQFSPASV